MSPATAELQRWGDGDGGGGGGGRGGGGETQWAHAAHLPASDREGRALVARAVHAQRCARVRAPDHRRCCSPPACRSFGTRASEGHRGASACKRSGPQAQGPARQPASRAPELARRRLPAQAAARGPLFGPRRSRTTCTCSAGSDPTRVKEEAPEPNCEASAGGAKGSARAGLPASHTCCVAVLSFSRHQLAQPSTFASPATLEVQVRGGGGRAGGGGGGGEVHTGHARHLHQLPQ